MIDDRSAQQHPNSDEVPPRCDEASVPTTFAVQLVLEVESREFAERVRSRLPDEETAGVTSEGYRSYVDSAGLDHPVIGASIPFDDLSTAVALYTGISESDYLEQSVRGGTISIRVHRDDRTSRDSPFVVASTCYP